MKNKKQQQSSKIYRGVLSGNKNDLTNTTTRNHSIINPNGINLSVINDYKGCGAVLPGRDKGRGAVLPGGENTGTHPPRK